MVQDNLGQESSQDSSKNSKDAFFDPKPKPKMIRILTVLAYVLSVSMTAIFLSVYYIFMWHGEPHLGAHRSLLVNKSFGKQGSSTGLRKPEVISSNVIAPQRLISLSNETVEQDNETSHNFIFSSNSTESIPLVYENTTVEDMQQQLIVSESETKVSVPTPTIFEDSNITWQNEYHKSSEDLKNPNIFTRKLFDRKDKN